MSEHTFIPPYGGYENLFSYQRARVVYRGTVHFVARWVPRISRTTDQMIQAARSGKKNLLEGSRMGRTSKELEIKLTNVARASLEELLDDYADYLRARDETQWDKESEQALFVRGLGRRQPQTFELYRTYMDTRPPDVLANIAICLIHQANYLIDQQLKRLEKDFVEQGGLREKMTRVRLQYRRQQGGNQ